MSAVPAVRASAHDSPLIDLVRALWPEASRAWGLSGGVLEGVRDHLHAETRSKANGPIWGAHSEFSSPMLVDGFANALPLARAIRERTGLLQYLPRIIVVEPRAEVAHAALARFAAIEDSSQARQL